MVYGVLYSSYRYMEASININVAINVIKQINVHITARTICKMEQVFLHP